MTEEQLTAVTVGARVLYRYLGTHDGFVEEISPSKEFYKMREHKYEPPHWIRREDLIEMLPDGVRQTNQQANYIRRRKTREYRRAK